MIGLFISDIERKAKWTFIPDPVTHQLNKKVALTLEIDDWEEIKNRLGD